MFSLVFFLSRLMVAFELSFWCNKISSYFVTLIFFLTSLWIRMLFKNWWVFLLLFVFCKAETYIRFSFSTWHSPWPLLFSDEIWPIICDFSIVPSGPYFLLLSTSYLFCFRDFALPVWVLIIFEETRLLISPILSEPETVCADYRATRSTRSQIESVIILLFVHLSV